MYSLGGKLLSTVKWGGSVLDLGWWVERLGDWEG